MSMAMLQFAVGAVVVMLPAVASPSTGVEQRFVQDRFAIGFWVDPPADDRMDARYAEIAEANFTVVLGVFGSRTPQQVKRQLDLCQRYGLKALVACDLSEPEGIPDGPACWGYLLKDEPVAAEFEGLADQVAMLRSLKPGRLAYINLFPDYVHPNVVGTASYGEYVEKYLDVVNPDVLSMDHYPKFRPGEPDGRDAYCRNLEVMRKYSLERGIPFWNFFNSMPFGPHTDPTEAQLRWQIYTSIAYGAKGVLYFCYYTPGGGAEFAKGGAIIARDDRRTRHWYQAQRINAELKNLGPTLMRLVSTGVHRLKPGSDAAGVLAGTPLKNVRRAPGDPELDCLVGTFEHEDGRRGVMLNNYRFAYTAWPTVVFDAKVGEVVEIDKRTGEERPPVDDSPDMPGLQLSLDAGDGRLFLLPAK